MAIKPILLNPDMVRAILDERKTQIRRVIEPQPINPRWNNLGWLGWADGPGHGHQMLQPCELADILYVREMWRPAKGIMHTYIGGEVTESGDWHCGFDYKAGDFYFPDGFKESNDEFHLSEIRSEGGWLPARRMPQKAARIFLRVKDVRVACLNSMSEEDAIAEGFADSPAGTTSPLERYSAYWDRRIKREDLREYGWHANPWVWVIEFERCEKPEGWCAA